MKVNSFYTTKMTILKLVCLITAAHFVFCSSENKNQIDKKEVESTSVQEEAVAPGSSSDTLIIEAQLIEAGTMAPNDIYDYVFVVKYKVESIEKGNYNGQEILVGHYNPLIPRKLIKDGMDQFVGGNLEKLEVGAVHRLVLIEPIESVWQNAVEDEYIDSEFARYYALQADLIR